MTEHDTDLILKRSLPVTQQLLLKAGAVVIGALLLVMALRAADVEETAGLSASPYAGSAVVKQYRMDIQERQALEGELETVKLELARANAIINYSADYKVPSDLAGLIYDTALKEGLDPELAFRIVQVESRFNPRAVSRAGAVGLVQVQPATARYYDRSITLKELTDPATNLRIGFRFLKFLLDKYDGNLEMALLAYNRGPARVAELLKGGRPPNNGYASTIMKGY